MTDKQKISEEVNKLISRLAIKYPKYKLSINFEINGQIRKNSTKQKNMGQKGS